MNAEEPRSELKTMSAPIMPIRSSAFVQRYILIQLLGSDGNGEVHLCRDVKLGTLVAVKTIQHDPFDGLLDEVDVLQFLALNSNIVRYHTMLQHPGQDFYI